jgi:hypothetical protein
MSSLRDRQIREVLDEDMNINRRAFDITKDQVRVFDESVLPKKTRDIEAEISVDKLVEVINKTIERKLVSLESLLSGITSSNRLDQRAYESVVDNGDIITAYNQLIRVFMTMGISRNSQEAIKVKFQEIKPNVDAIMYGLDELIRYLFQSGKSSKEIFNLVRSQAVYNVIDKQLYRGSAYRPIEQGDITVSIREMVSRLSQVQRAKLEDVSQQDVGERSLLKIPIELQNEEGKIRALEAELGVPLPRKLLAEFGGEEKAQAVSEFAEFNREALVRTDQQATEILQNYEQQKKNREDQIKQEKRDIKAINRQQEGLKAQSAQLMRAQRYFDVDDDKEDQDIVREVPLARDIALLEQKMKEKVDVINRLQREIKEIVQDIADFKANTELYKKELMGEMGTTGLRGMIPKARKRTVKEEVPEEKSLVKEEEEEEAPPELEQVEESGDRKPFFSRQYLMGLGLAQLLGLAADVWNYRPRATTGRDAIIREIEKRQNRVPRPQRDMIGFGRSGGNMMKFLPTNKVNVARPDEVYKQKRGLTERMRLEQMATKDKEEDMYGSGKMDFMDDRNDIYKVQRRIRM